MNYVMISKLGAGSFGNVYKVVNYDGENFALKIIEHSMFEDEDGDDRDEKGNMINLDEFTQEHYKEFSILSKLKHPNIIKYCSHNFDNNCAYLFTECWGKSINKCELDKNMIRNVMKQLTSALYYLHQNYIHRDIKENNIVFKDGIAKIIDFGKCIHKGRNDYRNETPFWYSAPENLLQDSSYTTAVDIWSLGYVFFKMQTTFYLSRRGDQSDQLASIFERIGLPDESSYLRTLKTWELFEKWYLSRDVKNLEKLKSLDEMRNVENLGTFDEECHNLMDKSAADLTIKMLCTEPSKRISADLMLKHDYFKSQNERDKII